MNDLSWMFAWERNRVIKTVSSKVSTSRQFEVIGIDEERKMSTVKRETTKNTGHSDEGGSRKGGQKINQNGREEENGAGGVNV